MKRIAAPAGFVVVSLMSLVACPALPAPPARTPTRTEVACAGMYSVRSPRTEGYVASGEQSTNKLLFSEGDSVYLHMAARRAIRPGRQFLVIRPARDPVRISWFRDQRSLEKRMGRLWEDVGRVRITRLAGSVVVARVESSCVPMERGDELVALRPRPVPSLPAAPVKDGPADFSLRAVGRVVSAKGFRQVLGSGYIAYVGWGTVRGARPGDRLVLFRRPGAEGVEIDRATGSTIHMTGFGRSQAPKAPGRLPRVILGHAVVLRVSPTAATIVITSARREIQLGDYAALE